MHTIVRPWYRFSLALLLLATLVLLLAPGLNEALFHWLNGFARPGADAFWANVTNLGDGLLATGIGVAVFSRLPRNIACMFVSVIVVGLLVQVGKHGFNLLGIEAFDLRPAARLGPDAVNVIGPTLKHYSFPSGHSAAAAALATLIALKAPSATVRVVAVLAGALIALSRAVVGAHWPVDIAAGCAVGVLGTLVSVWLVEKVMPEPDYFARIGLYLLAIVCGLALYRNHTRFDDYAGVNQVEYVVATVALALCAFRLIENAYRRFRLSRKVKDLTRHELVVSFAKFGLVGASGFLVDLGVFTLLNYLLSVPVEVTRGVAYWVAATWNWFFNRAFTFSEAEKVAHGAQWSKYLLMCLVSFFPNWGTFTALTRSSEFFAQYNQLALVAGVGAGMVFNFVGARFVIFKQGNSEASV